MSYLAVVCRYWHTLKHLRPVQFYGRLWFRLRRPRVDIAPAPPLRLGAGQWQSSARRTPSMTGPRSFRFLNEDGELRQLNWEEESRTRLWLYNLHYFDDLNAESAPQRDAWHSALMDDWIEHHQHGTGWEPYPSSLRIVNWCKRHFDGRPLTDIQRHSLATQVRWLDQSLEWHLLGNHLFANAKALVFAGLLFENSEADSWLKTGLKIVETELQEQVLPDGGNFERSPMYHAIFLEDLIDLLNAAQVFQGRIRAPQLAVWRQIASRMASWLQTLCHPDGEIALFNDAAIGVTPAPAALIDYARRLGVSAHAMAAVPHTAPTVTTLPESGYVRITTCNAVALLDVALIGPDYLPGHAHADTLSFELSVFGRRVVVNGGTSRYGLGPDRLRERGTAAHSTVLIDGQDSSEVWGGFRVARRARPFDLRTSTATDAAVVSCSHDGYRRLSGRPVHRREWIAGTTHLTVHDRIDGHFTTADARYHFHPSVRVESINSQILRLTLPGTQDVRMRVLQGTLRMEPSCYAPEFGKVNHTVCAVVSASDAQACVRFEWT